MTPIRRRLWHLASTLSSPVRCFLSNENCVGYRSVEARLEFLRPQSSPYSGRAAAGLYPFRSNFEQEILNWRRFLNRNFSSAAEAVEAVGEDVGEEEAKVEAEEELDVISAVLRSQTKKIAAKKFRAKGQIPAIVASQMDGHKGGHKMLVTVSAKEVSTLLRNYGYSFVLSRPVMLEVWSDTDQTQQVSRELVLPRSIQYEHASDNVLNVAFLRVVPGETMVVNVPLVYVGADACPGLKRGGYLNTIRRTVSYLCPSEKIPRSVQVDIKDLDLGQKILLQDLPVDPDLKLYKLEPDWPVCKIMTLRGGN